MASYQNPQVTNPILDDVNTIRELSKYNAKLDPSLGEGLESGMIRLADVSGGKQFQIYNGSSWAKIGKLINDADTLDGKHLSTSAVKNTIPMYNNSAMLVGSITGNAATATKLETVRTIDLGGQVVATAQSFDGSANITIPVTQLLVNNTADTAVKGTLTPLHGGTGRTDGASLDVVVDSLAGQVKASAYGQIGRAKQITSSTDLNTLVVDGNYASNGNVSLTIATNHAPLSYSDNPCVVNVNTYGNYINQRMIVGYGLVYSRQSSDGGASWSGWTSIGGTKSSVTIYVSKSGSDNNTGYESAYPVATINRAMQIAKGMMPRASNGSVKLCIGEGNWGSVTFDSLPFTILVYPFSGSSATEYSSSLPVFTLISATHSKVTVCSVVSTTLDAYNGYLSIGTGYKKTSYIRARYGGIVEIVSQNNTTNILDIFNSNITSPVIDAYHHGEIVIGDYQHILLSENINRIFLQANHLSKINCFASRITFDSTDAVNSGWKFQCFAGSSISTYEGGSNTLPTFLTSTLPGTGYKVANGAIINGIPYGTAWDADVLHLSGGTMKGNVSLLDAYSGRTTGSLTIGIGSKWNDAPSISFYGINDGTTPGYLELRAGANACRLGLNKDGNLDWSGSYLSVNNGAICTRCIELSYTNPYIDFHFNNSTTDYTSRIIETASGVLSINGMGVSSGGFTAYRNSVIETSSSPTLSLRSTGSDGHKKTIRASTNGNLTFGNENLTSGGCYIPSTYMSSEGTWNAIAVFSGGKLIYPNGTQIWVA